MPDMSPIHGQEIASMFLFSAKSFESDFRILIPQYWTTVGICHREIARVFCVFKENSLHFDQNTVSTEITL